MVLPDASILPLLVKIEIAPLTPLPSQTKEEAEGDLMLNFLRALPVLLQAKEDAEVANAIAGDEENGTDMDEQFPQ